MYRTHVKTSQATLVIGADMKMGSGEETPHRHSLNNGAEGGTTRRAGSGTDGTRRRARANRPSVDDATQDALLGHIQEEMEARALLAGLPAPAPFRVYRPRSSGPSRSSSCQGSWSSRSSRTSASSLVQRLDRVLAEHETDGLMGRGGQDLGMQPKEIMVLVAIAMVPPLALLAAMAALLHLL